MADPRTDKDIMAVMECLVHIMMKVDRAAVAALVVLAQMLMKLYIFHIIAIIVAKTIIVIQIINMTIMGEMAVRVLVGVVEHMQAAAQGMEILAAEVQEAAAEVRPQFQMMVLATVRMLRAAVVVETDSPILIHMLAARAAALADQV
jgi:hypothetical protein